MPAAPEADPSYLAFEHQIIEWVAEWSGRPIEQLGPHSLLNGAPVHADGDDAWELLEHLEQRSGTLFGTEFEFHRYFGQEAQLFDLWQRLTRKWPWRTEPIDVRDVARYLFNRHPH
jgi:hypothetical protein